MGPKWINNALTNHPYAMERNKTLLRVTQFTKTGALSLLQGKGVRNRSSRVAFHAATQTCRFGHRYADYEHVEAKNTEEATISATYRAGFTVELRQPLLGESLSHRGKNF